MSGYRLGLRTWYAILVTSWLVLVPFPLSFFIVAFDPGMPFSLFLQQMAEMFAEIGSLQMLLNPPLGSMFFLLVWSPVIAAPLGLFAFRKDAQS